MKLKTPAILFFLSLATFAMSGCTSLPNVVYANREWHISDYYGQIIDSDTTYRMTFGEVLIPKDLEIISCSDSAAKYPGMDRFIAHILKTAGLSDDEVLFYAPAMGKMFVKLNTIPLAGKPSSLTSDMNDDRQYTMWIYDDDVEDWHRMPGEMYTYTYIDKRHRRILVVDYYDYGVTPIAQIHVLQSRNKMTDKMMSPARRKQLWDFFKHDLNDYERDIEFWAHRIDLHRENAIANYKIGQEQLIKTQK